MSLPDEPLRDAASPIATMSGASALEALVQQKSFSWTADRQHIKIDPYTFSRKTLTPYKSARSSTPPSKPHTERPAGRNWTGCLVALLGASLHWRASLLLCHMWLLRVVAACGEHWSEVHSQLALDHRVTGDQPQILLARLSQRASAPAVSCCQLTRSQD